MSTTDLSAKPPEMSKAAYDPKEVEAKWTADWHANQVFNLDINPDKPPFSIALPPPNITGNLHMGHALNGTLQDVLIRLKRMQGYNVHWQPGTDHAGISTQMVVERQLKKQGKNRHELGREKFNEEVWKWRVQYGDSIMEQYKRLGVSFNWDRIAFTMDPGYVKAIYRAFFILYKEGHIYRGKRVTNWCPRCLTSLSDLEVEHVETAGHLYHIKYAVADGEGALVVATTRPETMFGDVAVAVHPEDDRYKHFIGKLVRLPLTDRKIPVIADSYVEKDFGTGALKITPAHDANDWEVGQRHKLEAPVVIDPSGKLSANEFVPQQFQGKDRFVVRDLAVEELQQRNLMVEIKDYTHGVGHCERCNTVIEPYLSEQWYLSMKELAGPAIQAVEEERIRFIPDRYAAMYLDWMRNIRDWNISRQLWWGHRIPIWTCDQGHVLAYEETPTACTTCSSTNLTQDEDVLDTWFSSALWPFATLGWPEETNELKVFFPTTVLSTAREIIYLWVSRMIFTSMHFLKKIPFKEVVIHPVVQTPDGKRMSKSKGNAIDPLLMIDKYGADANRFWFTSVGVKGDQDVRFQETKLEEYKRFANKLWNAGRFVLTQLEGYTPRGIDQEKLSMADRWILHRYNHMLMTISTAFNDFDFHIAANELYTFTWDYFCDWYLEIAKIQIAQEGQAIGQNSQTKRVLHTIFEGLMRAMHPIMPFITEDLWERVPKSILFQQLDSVMFAPYPRADQRFFDEKADERMAFLMRIIRAIRNLRQTYDVPPSAEAQVILISKSDEETNILKDGEDYIKGIAKANPISLQKDGTLPKLSAKEIVSSVTVCVPLGGLINIEKSKEKLVARKQSVEKEIEKKRVTLDSPEFRAKAPKDKIEKLDAELADLQNQLDSIKSQLSVLDEHE
jgi:valyl-tRNA synthetase